MPSRRTRDTTADEVARHKVIIVDDDVNVLTTLLRWFEDSEFEPLVCQTMATARQCLDTCKPDVLLTDVRIHGTNGLFLALLADRRAPRVKVVVMSGFDDPVLKQEARDLHADFLVKPLSKTVLFAALRRPEQQG